MTSRGIVVVFKNLSGNDHEIQFDSGSTKAVSSLLWAFVQLPAKAGIVPVVEQSATGISLPSFEPRSFGEFSPKTNPVSVSGHSELLLMPLWVEAVNTRRTRVTVSAGVCYETACDCERIEHEQQRRHPSELESVRAGYNVSPGLECFEMRKCAEPVTGLGNACSTRKAAAQHRSGSVQSVT